MINWKVLAFVGLCWFVAHIITLAGEVRRQKIIEQDKQPWRKDETRYEREYDKGRGSEWKNDTVR